MTETRRVGNPLWTAYEYFSMLSGMALLALICLLWLPFALLLHFLLPRRPGRYLGRRVISAGFRFVLGFLSLFCGFRFDLSELKQLRNEGPLIICANHPSLMDAAMLVACLPNAVCVMKAALMDNLLFGAAARLARYIRNDEPLGMVLCAREELGDGAQLVIFPEGTRTSNFPLDTCLPSAALIASRSGVPVQTLLIEFSTPYLGKHWPFFMPPILPLHARIRLGERFAPQAKVEVLTRAIEAYLRRELEAGHKHTPNAASPA